MSKNPRLEQSEAVFRIEQLEQVLGRLRKQLARQERALTDTLAEIAGVEYAISREREWESRELDIEEEIAVKKAK